MLQLISVTPLLLCWWSGRRPYRHTIPASVLRPILPESVQPAHSLRHASTVTHDRPTGVDETYHRLLIDYYKTNINYEKNQV